MVEKFIQAHEQSYEQALKEIKQGRKRSHWMWYIFPQIKGLGHSDISKFYAINSVEEAKQYMGNELLRSHMFEICQALLDLKSEDALAVMGYPDNMKLQSSMTLFSVSNPEYCIFTEVLEKYFNGNTDERTLEIISGV